ncbi:MAG: pyridoxal-dependent decarboxylase [Chloroflexota bacterium]
MKKNQLYSGATPAEVAKDLESLLDFQAEGVPLEQLKTMLDEKLVPHLLQYGTPNFQSMFNAFPTSESRLGGEMMLDFNQGVTNWQVSPGGAMLETLACKKLCQLFGLDDSADATFMYSGTYANQQAIYMALHHFAEKKYRFDLGEQGLSHFPDLSQLVILVSADAHFSMRHAVRMLGLGEKGLVKLPVDSNRRIDAHASAKLVEKLRLEREIVAIVGTSGTTSTGSIDPLDALADLAEETKAWYHIDGAYGYAYKLVDEWADRFNGDTRADSITWDAHKQLQAPVPNSMLFVRNGLDFGRMSLYSGYFNRKEDEEPNPGVKSPPTTRPMSVLPLVTILRGQGLDRIKADLKVPLQAIKDLYHYLLEQPDFEPVHEPDTGILCFLYRPEGMKDGVLLDQLQRQVYDSIMGSGRRSISMTRLDGKPYLRLVSVAPIVRYADFLETIEQIRSVTF